MTGTSFANYGIIHYNAGNFTVAAAFYDRAAVAFREEGNSADEAGARECAIAAREEHYRSLRAAG